MRVTSNILHTCRHIWSWESLQIFYTPEVIKAVSIGIQWRTVMCQNYYSDEAKHHTCLETQLFFSHPPLCFLYIDCANIIWLLQQITLIAWRLFDVWSVHTRIWYWPHLKQQSKHL